MVHIIIRRKRNENSTVFVFSTTQLCYLAHDVAFTTISRDLNISKPLRVAWEFVF